MLPMQRVMLVTGHTALGLVAGFLAVYGLCLLIQSKPGEWGEAYFIQFLLIAGTLAGGVAGAVLGYRRVTRQGTRTWKKMTWIGIIGGVLLGWCCHYVYSGLLHDVTRVWWIALIPIVAMGMIGGVVSQQVMHVDRKAIPRPFRRKKVPLRRAG